MKTLMILTTLVLVGCGNPPAGGESASSSAAPASVAVSAIQFNHDTNTATTDSGNFQESVTKIDEQYEVTIPQYINVDMDTASTLVNGDICELELVNSEVHYVYDSSITKCVFSAAYDDLAGYTYGDTVTLASIYSGYPSHAGRVKLGIYNRPMDNSNDYSGRVQLSVEL